MAANYWVSFKDARRIGTFVVAVLAICLFWSLLPADVRHMMGRRYVGRRSGLAAYMFIAWIGGWFTLLFVRAEDRNIVTPYDYKSLCKVVGLLMIVGATFIAGVYVLGYHLYKNA